MQYHFNALQPNFEPVIRLYQHATQPYPRQLCRQRANPLLIPARYRLQQCRAGAGWRVKCDQKHLKIIGLSSNQCPSHVLPQAFE